MGSLDALQSGLEEMCRRLHNGESVPLAMSPQVDANAASAIRHVIEGLYRDLFAEELIIESMQRDEHGVLRISVAKKEGMA